MYEMIRLLGKKLSESIQKPSLTCNGVIRFAIKEFNGGDFSLNYSDLINMLNTTLRMRLERLHILHVDQIIRDLQEFVIDNQSLILMSL